MNESIENRGLICIQKILAGEQEAFRDFILLFQRLVYSITSKLIVCQEDQDDICQTIFIKAYQNLDQFRGDSKISTWIGKMTYNTCLNYLRRKKHLCLEDHHIDHYSNKHQNTRDTPDHLTETQDMSIRLHHEMNRLPAQMRTALTLYHIQGLTYDEIASVMSCPEGTVKSHLYRARQLLKKRLLEKYQKEELIG
ncbi:sigma-70 family RNA polymerase sigma factor [bacterium]|nr:sigma-70 family RNA polymerase sigma factor [bacterium]